MKGEDEEDRLLKDNGEEIVMINNEDPSPTTYDNDDDQQSPLVVLSQPDQYIPVTNTMKSLEDDDSTENEVTDDVTDHRWHHSDVSTDDIMGTRWRPDLLDSLFLIDSAEYYDTSHDAALSRNYKKQFHKTYNKYSKPKLTNSHSDVMVDYFSNNKGLTGADSDNGGSELSWLYEDDGDSRPS